MKLKRAGRLTCCVVLLTLAYSSRATTFAQDRSQQTGDARKPASTAEAWKQAMPEAEEVAPAAESSHVNAASAEETREQTEKRLGELEQRWMAAVQTRDAATLRQLVAADFTHTDTRPDGVVVGRKQYLAGTVRDWKLESFGFDELVVRLYANSEAAVVSGRYRQQATVAGADWSGDFLFTDVWVRQAGAWRVVSRHLSRLPAGTDKRK